MGEKKTTRQFIQEAKEVHGDKYGYSKTIYTYAYEKVVIYCRACKAYFEQMAGDHLYNGAGCPRCADIQNGLNCRSNTDEFIQKAQKVHPGLYDYSRVEYILSRLTVIIGCVACGK